MKLAATAASIVFAAAVLAQTPSPEKTAPPAAVINGEVITASKLDALYSNMTPAMRAQYEESGGKKAFLENYIAKRLLIQEAMKRGFDQRPDVQAAIEAARESALFDRYVREVVAADIVPDATVRSFYDENIQNFQSPEKVKVRHIVIATKGRSPDQAREIIARVFSELQAQRNSYPPTSEGSRQIFTNIFADAARKYSEDGSGPEGGDLGWVSRGQLDPTFEKVAFGMPAGIMSGIIETQFGLHLVLVEDKKPAGPKPFEDVRREIREYLFAQKQSEIMSAVTRLTRELRRTSSVSVYTENVE